MKMSMRSRVVVVRILSVILSLFACAMFACAPTKPTDSPVATAHRQTPSTQPSGSGSPAGGVGEKSTRPLTDGSRIDGSRTDGARIDGNQAMQYVRQVVGFGPRYIGSPGHKKTEDYLRSHLKASILEEDAFTAATPVGNLPIRNFVAKFPGTKDG